MNTWAYILVGLAVVVGPTLTAVVLLRKAPAETRKITVDTMDVNVNVAGKLRDKAVEDWERMGRELDELRGEFNSYKADTQDRLAELSAELRAEKAEKRAVKTENDRLRKRVDELEAEVTRLKAFNGFDDR